MTNDVMKYNLLKVITLQFILLCIVIQGLAQNPDSRENYMNRLQPAETVIPAIGLKEGMVVGEIGAGRGRYTVILADAVGEKGHIYANDIDREDLDYLELRCERDYIQNISIIIGEENDPLLPVNELDMIFMVNVYHHLSHPVQIMQNALPSLKKGGTLVIMEGVPGRQGSFSSHSTEQETVVSQMEEAGYSFEKVAVELEQSNVYIFSK
jgi:ubiquinone/menaquinone biosynthesis C-methylase UbiE